MATTFRDLYKKIRWFGKRTQFDIDFFEILQPQRTINQDSRYITGQYFSGKCNREIQYESGLELSFFEQLEEFNDVLFFWEQPIRIPYWRGKRKDTYTPDIAVYLNTKEIVIVEIKDLPSMLNYRVQTKTEALIEFCHQKGFGFLITDGKNTIDTIIKTKINRKLEKAILKEIDNRIIRKRECNELMKFHEATQNELLKIILIHNLKFKSFPLKIQQDNRNKIFRQVFFEKEATKKLQTKDFQKYLTE